MVGARCRPCVVFHQPWPHPRGGQRPLMCMNNLARLMVHSPKLSVHIVTRMQLQRSRATSIMDATGAAVASVMLDTVAVFVRELVRSCRLVGGYRARKYDTTTSITPLTALQLFSPAAQAGFCSFPEKEMTAHAAVVRFTCMEGLCHTFQKEVDFFVKYG